MDGTFEIKDAQIEDYRTSLQEHSRPPSRGGNQKALHRHALIINGEEYSFFVNGRLQWVHKRDRVSFRYKVVKGQYKNILPETLQTVDSMGRQVVRGMRGVTKKLRTVPTKPPASRRERRD
ncbi:hypothetical protein [Myxococcus faecalis]|uniref:hypothetical protein n=1 Tax=Myxococcus faecalis TaxID=3115646 RepID=UPI003CFB50B8